MEDDQDQQDFRTPGDRYRARKRLRAYQQAARNIITDDALTNADNFLNGEDEYEFVSFAQH